MHGHHVNDCRKTAFIYLVIGLSAVLGNIWFSPISVIPDEPNHFARALQISGGNSTVKEWRPPNQAVIFPTEMMRVLHAYDDINFQLINVFRLRDWLSSNKMAGVDRQILWNRKYGCKSSLVLSRVVVGIWLGKIFHFSVFTTFMLARALTGLLAVTLTTFAVALCRRGTLFLMALASMPMTLHLFGSCSQDALLISAAFMARGAPDASGC